MANSDGEYTPLVGGQQKSNKDSWYSQFKGTGMVVLIGLVAFLYFTNNNESVSPSEGVNTTPLQPPPVPVLNVEEEGTQPRTMYRPFCLTHDGTRSARILQTSMGAPSQQWSHIPCYEQSKETMQWAKKKKPDVKLNAFRAPDAIMQLNLSRFAHPTRPTPILGFGSAFTEASALNYDSLSPVGKETLMELLYGSTGLGYSLGRVHINSCDFSVESYSFDETDGDFELDDFDMNVTHDVSAGMVDMILRATSVFRTDWSSADGLDGKFKMSASVSLPPI